MKGERGFALVIALVITALLVALLVEFVSEVYVDTAHSHNFVAAQQAAILAESGIGGGKQLLTASALLRQGQDYSSLSETWAKPFSYDAGVGTVTITIEEESGKFNINTATSDQGDVTLDQVQVLRRLLNNLKLSPDLKDAVIDWADKNDTPLPGGAETSYYSTLKFPYAAKNAKLDTLEELALVKGFTPEVLTKLRALLTVYYAVPGESITKVNINTAPKEVLIALDDKMSDTLVDRILEFRKTTPIKGPGDVSQISGLDTVLPYISTKITYGGNVYRIHAEGRVGETVSVAEAVVRMGSGLTPGTPPILYWREY